MVSRCEDFASVRQGTPPPCAIHIRVKQRLTQPTNRPTPVFCAVWWVIRPYQNRTRTCRQSRLLACSSRRRSGKKATRGSGTTDGLHRKREASHRSAAGGPGETPPQREPPDKSLAHVTGTSPRLDSTSARAYSIHLRVVHARGTNGSQARQRGQKIHFVGEKCGEFAASRPVANASINAMRPRGL